MVLTDIRMPPTERDEGIQAARRVRETSPEVGVVVLSHYSHPGYALALLEDGSEGRAYLLKERIEHLEQLTAAIRAVGAGGSVIDPKVVEALVGQAFDRRLGPVTTFDEGNGPIVDMSLDRHRLYVLETFATESPWQPGTGRVVRRDGDGRRSVVASGLNFPIGMASPGGRRCGRALYISTVSYGQGPVEGLGRIVRVRLR